jgi:hypothetical protein
MRRLKVAGRIAPSLIVALAWTGLGEAQQIFVYPPAARAEPAAAERPVRVSPVGGAADRHDTVGMWLNRKPGADGKLPPAGNTVDVANATWANTIGATELITTPRK